MKYILMFIMMVACRSSYSQQKVDTLRNETIIKLTKAKLPENIIIQKVNQSVCRFDISVDSLIKLKENQVSDSVINLMIKVQGKANSEQIASIQKNSNDKNYVFPESGIYFIKNDKYLTLDPTIATTTMPKGILFNVKFKSQIEGTEANYQFEDRRQEFYFNFKPMKKELNSANANSTSSNNYLDELMNRYTLANNSYQAISPNDFRLIRLDKNGKRREFTSGKINSLGRYDMSVADKNIVNFKYEKISENTYKIIFEKDLSKGEYCFYYIGNNTNQSFVNFYGQNNFKVFDFGIK